MKEKDFILPDYSLQTDPGKTGWKAPSNIALVKYWGKKGDQIPANASLSFTLDTSATSTTVDFRPRTKDKNGFSYDLFYDGKPNAEFRAKIDKFLIRIEDYLPFLRDFHFEIHTSNSFPHSSGIASSASGFAALAMCLLEIEKKMNSHMTEDFFHKKASFLARLGSGSAARSISGPMMHWGKHDQIDGSSDLFAIDYPHEVHPVFKTFRDVILLVDKGQKSVSSSAGHGLMQGHIFASKRFDQAYQNLVGLKECLQQGDLDKFISLVENEALSLHAMMMTSIPYYLLMKPNTIAIIERIWDFRRKTNRALCFTLDAGANVHLLFPVENEAEINQFIDEELLSFCQGGGKLDDRVGNGCHRIN